MFWTIASLAALAFWLLHQGRELDRLRRAVAEQAVELKALKSGAAAERTDVAPAPVLPPLVPLAPVLPVVAPHRERADAADQPPQPPPEVPARTKGRPLGELLAEKGLAWAGGAGLALGGALLVGYMAQQGWFTPAVRLVAAGLLGAGLIVFGEIVRRRGDRTGGPLVAALAAGSGSAVLYAAAWAAHVLYGYIGRPAAAVSLALVSGLLLALAFRHGQALALLALAGAYAAPLVTGAGDWGDPALPGYLVLVLATGAATAVRRRWTGAAGLSIGGVLLWALAEAVQGDARVVFLALAAATAALALAARRREPLFLRLGAFTPVIAAGVVSVAAVLHGMVWAQAGTTALLLFAAYGLQRRIAGQDAFAAVALIGAAGLLASGLLDRGGVPAMLAHAALSVPAVLAAARGLERRATATAFVAAGAVVLAAAAGLVQGGASEWLAPAAIAGVLAAAAAVSARGRGETPDGDWWAAAAAGSALVAVVQLSDTVSAPAALAAVVFALAAVHRRASWLGVRIAAAAAAALALGSGLYPDFIEAGWAAAPAPALVSAVVGAVLLWAGSRLLGTDRRLKEGLATTAVGLALIAAFIAVNWFTRRGTGQPLDDLSRAALNGLLLLGGGLAALVGEGPDSGPIAKARSRLLLAAGVIFTLPLTGLLSPWWGFGERVVGAPLIDSLLLAYLAPAVLLGFAADRLYRRGERAAARAAAAASTAFAGLWVLHVVRRLADGPVLRGEAVGVFEASAYAVAGLASGLVFEALRRRRRAPPDADMGRAAAAFGWAGLVLAAVLLAGAWNPWWGHRAEPLGSLWAAAAIIAVHAAAAGLSLVVARARLQPALGAAGRVSAVLHVFVGLTLAVRAAYRGPDLRPAAGGAGLETWTYSAAWALLGVAVLVAGDRRGDAVLRWCGLVVVGLTLAKVLLFDIIALEGVVRAGSFLAVGALLLLGALLAKRRLQA